MVKRAKPGNPTFGVDYAQKINYGRERPFDDKILLRLYSEDREKLEAIAATKGQTVSDLLRSLIQAL
jgi:hypothetical protein